VFAEGTEWKMPWLARVLPNIVSLVSAYPEKTIFTRFIPARRPGQARESACGGTIMSGGDR
jgi:nicotinamidase-related amidase